MNESDSEESRVLDPTDSTPGDKSGVNGKMGSIFTKWLIGGGIVVLAGALFEVGRMHQTMNDLRSRTEHIEVQRNEMQKKLFETEQNVKSQADDVAQLKAARMTIECELAASQIRWWFSTFEIELWRHPISKLSIPAFRTSVELSDQISASEKSLRSCAEGQMRLKELNALRNGLLAFHSGQYAQSYKLFSDLDQRKSLTQRFLGAAKTKEADLTDDASARFVANQHLRNAYEQARVELSSHLKEETVEIMRCNSYSLEAHEVEEGISCWKALADKKIKASFAYVALASIYSALSRYGEAISMLKKFQTETPKDVGRDTLRKDIDIMKLLNSEFREEFLEILNDSNIPP